VNFRPFEPVEFNSWQLACEKNGVPPPTFDRIKEKERNIEKALKIQRSMKHKVDYETDDDDFKPRVNFVLKKNELASVS
jgi:hypothetical protein